MLVCRTHDTELLAKAESVLDSTFPLAWTHVVEIVDVTHVSLGKSVARKHLYERSLVSLAEETPVVSSVTGLVTHVMRSDKYLLAFELLLPVLD